MELSSGEEYSRGLINSGYGTEGLITGVHLDVTDDYLQYAKAHLRRMAFREGFVKDVSIKHAEHSA